MEPTGVKRKLAVILAADVEGYTRLMRADEEATLKTLSEYREIMNGLIARHEGRVVDMVGDSVLAEFGSAVESVRCAIAIQEEIATRNAELPDERKLQFRIGINVGDVIVKGDALFGDGVNVAARLEGLAEPGGICISGSVFEQIKHKLSLGFEDMGRQEVKNIAEPISAYRLVPGPVSVQAKTRGARGWRIPVIAAVVVVIVALAGSLAWWQPWAPDVEPASVEKMAYPLPDKPSIAVLPFTNMSGDPEQEYFSDGITEDIITDLSKVSGLFVTSRTATLRYKGKPVDPRRVSRELGVRYLLEGSVRKATGRLRITAQLIDTKTGNHMWAERYDRDLKDVFAIQDDVAKRVVKELAVTLKADEQERLFRRHTENLEAYETFLRARRVLVPTKELAQRAKKLFERVVELDPRFAGGYAGLSFVYAIRVRHGLSASREEDIERALELAQKAIATDDTFGWSYLALGGAYLIKGEHDKAVAALQEAVRIQPSDADAHLYLGFYLHWSGQGDEAIRAVKTAMRLNPKPRRGRPFAFLGQAYFTAGRYEDAIATLNQRYASFARLGTPPLGVLAAAYAAMGQDEKARAVMKVFLDKHPGRTLSNYQHPRLYKRKEDRDRIANQLRRAGMPEK